MQPAQPRASHRPCPSARDRPRSNVSRQTRTTRTDSAQTAHLPRPPSPPGGSSSAACPHTARSAPAAPQTRQHSQASIQPPAVRHGIQMPAEQQRLLTVTRQRHPMISRRIVMPLKPFVVGQRIHQPLKPRRAFNQTASTPPAARLADLPSARAALRDFRELARGSAGHTRSL